jgi:AmmeMemoRadiSam system protein B
MTHYEPQAVAERQDLPLIDLMLRLDADGFWHERQRTRASVCGYAPITAALTAARLLGAVRGEKLSYYTSGEMHPGPVVGYASVALLR